MLTQLICLALLMPLQAEGGGHGAAPPEEGVSLHERTGFGGVSRVLEADVADLADVPGPCGDGERSWARCISSLRLASGWAAILYERPDFEGESLAVTSDVADLTSFSGCHETWDSCARSIRVEKQLVHHGLAGTSAAHPQDISDEAGLFVYSHDGRNALRIFGSFRMLGVLDDRPTFHPYDLVSPMIPTGDANFPSLNSEWTINMSRFGIDALVGRDRQPFSSALLIRMEVDWKGDEERFRIRHFFLRSDHWLIGKSWSTFNNLAFLPLAVDGRLAGGGVGIRPPQVRYYSRGETWSYQVSLEHRATTMVKPASLNAISRIVVPDVVGRVGHRTKRSETALGAILRQNRLQFPDEDSRVQQLPGYGFFVGFKYRLSDRDRLKLSVSGGSGMGTYLADYAWTDIDVAYNPAALEFESVGVLTGFAALEHDWTKELSSTIGGSFLGSERKPFFEELQYIDGYKVLANLFYKRPIQGKQFVFGVEVEYAERTNMNGTRNGTTRASALVYYDF